MFVFLAVVAVIGAWGGHVRIQQRIEARAKEKAVVVAPVQVQQDRKAVEIVGPADLGQRTRNEIENAIYR
ncbi:hypothetical protein NPS53_09135 [Pseudomonas putida]|uniref:hypothetical protein n=1 Tax=Pseudomonas putida TaxID=303 RepID=UPI0023633D26|nr:hypothetical protein [Pseudomonas putida]MDD2139739.1 hypothetical protein [Pseudomonas putida]HDS1721663.1 hypothetical protein [Pseudomonas putida]